jgi:endogenous inhibitor of DNA gyrase (YacG/DUF329 family)
MQKKSSKFCAICGAPVTEAHQPFCSARCKDADLYKWLIGSYAIPGDDVQAASEEDGDDY